MADFLVVGDLISAVGNRKVLQWFDDQYNGTLSDDTVAIDDVLSRAEAEMYGRMLRAYPSDTTDPTSPLRLLVANDPALKGHVIGVALQYASERRPEFTDADGAGSFKARYDRAIDYFETLSKGIKRSRGEIEAGKGANTGGLLQPKPPAATERQFIFAPGRNSPFGHGGF